MNAMRTIKHTRWAVAIAAVSMAGVLPAVARDLTLDQALDIGLTQSTRGRMVRGSLEVAEQAYFARRINFYVPEISINGSVPAYSLDESYRFFGGASEKSLYKTTTFGLQSFLQFKQSLITGGEVTFKANLLSNKDNYPNTSTGLFVDERSRRGFFNFSLEQPLLKPSVAKNELHDKRDDLEIARIVMLEEEAKLRRDIVSAYVGLLQQQIKSDQAAAKLESARLKSQADSSKMADSILSEEDWLLSSSARLDAELDQSTAANDLLNRKRELTGLLDMDMNEPLDVFLPALPRRMSDEDRRRIENSWENSTVITKAELQYRKSDRAASFAAGSHGLTGSLTANYDVGRGKIRIEGRPDDNINTNGYGVALNFSFPIWDGGASSASVKASRFTAEQSRLEYERIQKGARAEITALLNQIDVGYRRLEILQKQIDVHISKVAIADERFKDGQISRVTYLAGVTALYDARLKYLVEMTTFLSNKADLNGKLPGAWD